MRTLATPTNHPAAVRETPSTSLFQPEIQGLRAVAVLLVVLYHLWPVRLTGGYVGVDIFFVISGFLITSHMYREVQDGSALGLTRFWARRIRRLLPASLLVLLVTVFAAFLWIPSTLWEVTARQIGASALYIQNWVLAADSVDYSAQHNDASAVQHYWSLSVEEQFYFVWPLLVAVLLYIARRPAIASKLGPLSSPRGTMIAGIAFVGALSLIYSVFLTAHSPSVAYFVTPTRVWEFSAGGLAALIFNGRQYSRPLATALAWVGMALIGYAAVTFDSATPFPGWWAMLPVLGTALVVICGGNTGRTAPRWWLSRRPAIFLGDVSYGVYLWHWPLIVVLPFILDHDMGTLEKLLVLAASTLLAWITKLTVEDPLRRGRLLKKSLRAYLFAAAGMALTVAMCFGVTSAAYSESSPDRSAELGACYGPGALEPANGCGPVVGTEAPSPAPAMVAKQNTQPLHPGCQAKAAGTDVVSCDLGVDASQASETVAIVGDSHATAWFPALEALAKDRGWRIKTYTKSSCPVTAAVRILASEKTDSNQRDCLAWGQKVARDLAADKDVSTIFAASYSTAFSFESPGNKSFKIPAVDGFVEVWRQWLAAGKQLVVFEDVPRTTGEYVPTCLARQKDALACAITVDKAIPSNTAITNAARAMSGEGVKRIVLRDQFCDDKICYPVVGSMIVYRDFSHISAEYARALAPYIATQLP
jgi:peptidoglycan/LPS O-acetylase OafA/YrhL